MNYQRIEELPAWAVLPIKKLISAGVIQYNENGFEFPLDECVLKTVLILFRLGIM